MTLAQVTPRGQITLPAEIRKALGIKGGDAFDVVLDGGRIVLQPVVTIPVRTYTDEELEMFDHAQVLSDDERDAVMRRWRV